MKKNIFKKIIALMYLTIFLFGLFVPFSQSFAADIKNRLTITAEPSTIKQDADTGMASTRITAEVYTTKGEEIISFSTTTILSTFTPDGTKNGICTTPKHSLRLISGQVDSCSVVFKTGTVGSLTITSSFKTNEKTYLVSLPVTVCKPSQTIVNNVCTDPVPIPPETPNCVAPKRLNDDKTACITDTNTTYTPLAGLPGLPADQAYETKTSCPFGNYLNIMIKLIIGIAAILAMVMIVMGGIQYMTSDLISSKEAGKEQITHAILGLLLALGAFIILNTINPKLLSACLDKLPEAKITISADDTSTGSSTTLCISSNPPNPDSAKGTSMKPIMSKPAMPEYEKVANTITSISKGKRYLITAQAGFEGFFPNSKSYKTNNPGNIGNTDDGKTRSYPTLAEGIQAQVTKVVSGQGSYKVGSKPTCALGNEAYDGSLYQYLRIYATGARENNNYVNAVIGYFKDNGKNITARTKMDEIYNMN